MLYQYTIFKCIRTHYSARFLAVGCDIVCSPKPLVLESNTNGEPLTASGLSWSPQIISLDFAVSATCSLFSLLRSRADVARRLKCAIGEVAGLKKYSLRLLAAGFTGV